MKESRVLWVLAAVLLVCNLVDGIFTMAYVHVGMAEEANPLMDMFLRHSFVAFIVAKLALVSVGVGALWKCRATKTARVGLVVVSVAYVALVCYHVAALVYFLAY